MTDPDLQGLEGRLIAHRKALAFLMAQLVPKQSLTAYLETESTPSDGQEDPGAVPSEAFAILGAVADEFRLLADCVDRARQARRNPP